VSLNHRRRIFRQNTMSVSSLAGKRPTLGVFLAIAGGAATLVLVAGLFVRPSEAPAHAPASSELSAEPDRLAVLDGETIRIGDQLVRLEGIVAPARGSLCHGADQGEIDCGSAAANALASLIRGSRVSCIIRGHDLQGRPLANCVAAGKRLPEAMVLNGWARADAVDLQAQETAARAAGRGVWRTGS
jgi:endonuclease YncB( thermonuclease family)